MADVAPPRPRIEATGNISDIQFAARIPIAPGVRGSDRVALNARSHHAVASGGTALNQNLHRDADIAAGRPAVLACAQP
eukprot:6177484-Pleurochrysis_carterae.AAC.1